LCTRTERWPPRTSRRICNALAIHGCERREPVVLGTAIGPDVDDAPAPCHERVRDEPSVAAPPERLRAHERRRALPRDRLHLHQPGLELRASHVIRVAAEAARG